MEFPSSKALQEQIDDLAIEARAIMETVETESREPNETEAARFDDITDKLIPELQNKLATATKREDKMVKLAAQTKRQSKVAELAQLLNTGRSPRILDEADDEDGEDKGRVFVRHSKLRCFENNAQAFDAGMWLRAVSAKERNRDDVKALQHCQRRGLAISNAMSEGTGAGGGYVVPAQISSSIIAVRENVGVARRVCSIMPMGADTLTIPKRAGGLTVYAPGEGNAITGSDASLAQIELINKKRAVLAQLSQELNDDALISISDLLFTEMAYALALQEDKELINGTGAGATYFGVRGLLNRIGSAAVATAATGNDTWPELTLADMTAAIALLPERFDRNPSWICSRNFYHGVMVRLEAQAGGNTIDTLRAGAKGEPVFLGYPVYITSQMPTATATATVCALFGSFADAVVLGDRGGITMSRDDSVGFTSDLITLKATSRYDINVHEPGTASVVGAYTAVKTAS